MRRARCHGTTGGAGGPPDGQTDVHSLIADRRYRHAQGGGLFARLRSAAGPEPGGDWHAYTHHEFVERLADGTLPLESFKRYLVQDYLYLVHFARCYALAVYKADTLEDMREGAAGIQAILGTEMNLHVALCREWGLGEQAMLATPEAPATLAYSRYVLERGMAGDLLDLYTALAPCAVGYGEIGWRLARDPRTRLEGNPYREPPTPASPARPAAVAPAHPRPPAPAPAPASQVRGSRRTPAPSTRRSPTARSPTSTA